MNLKTLLVLITTLMVLMFGVSSNAEAKRLGGGKSVGQQSSNVTQKQNTPPAAAPNTPAAPAPAAPKPWGAMLGGLAAGLGLAWLASSLGLGGAMGNILTVLLIGVAVMLLVGWFMRRKLAAAAPAPAMQGAGAGMGGGLGGLMGSLGGQPAQPAPSAQPTPFTSMPNGSSVIGSGIGSGIGAGLAGSQGWGVPANFDADGFLTAAKRNFVGLQAAWDKSDISTLRGMMTDTMLVEIKSQLAERDVQNSNTPNHTEVVTLDARLLGIEENATEYLASVEFSGMIREDAVTGATPFREVWNMNKPLDGSRGWLVAGIQALQ